MHKTVEAERIIAVLDGIEKRPFMYSTALEGIEGIYYVLLSLLDEDRKVPQLFVDLSAEMAGKENWGSMASNAKSVEHLIEYLKKARKEIIPG